MRLWTLPLRILGILLLAVLVSGAWLFRREIVALIRPSAVQPDGAGQSRPVMAGPEAASRAHDKVDSLHGWRADSVVLSPAEMAALVQEGLPAEARRHLDSLSIVLGDGRLTLAARLETAAIPRDQLGPLAGALRPWEPVSAGGVVAVRRAGVAEWRVDSVTIRGFTLPEETSRELMSRTLNGTRDGAIPVTLPPGIVAIRIRPGGVVLFREETR
jgi:hypothetical protein